MKPWCSIIISTKNNELTIKHVLRSTLTLANAYDVELIIVEGGSVDNTYSIISNFTNEFKHLYFSVKILRDPGISLSYARHIGFMDSEGEIVVFLDGDTGLTSSFKYYLEEELAVHDLISPLFIVVPVDRTTRTFNLLLYTHTALVLKNSNATLFNVPPAARVYKRKVLERIRGYPISSRFFGEDRIATALAIRLGFRHKFSTRLKLFKIDEPGFRSYWKKHYRYALGIHRDLTSLGRSILRGYILARRLNHINALFSILSILYAGRSFATSRNIRESIEVSLMKYLIDLAMFIGDLRGSIYGKK